MDSLWNTTANIYFPDKKKNLDKVNLYIEYKKTEIGKICKNVKKMAMQYPDATENDIFKYLEIEYNMNSKEMELFHKECLVEEEVKKTRRTSETINKKNENLKSFVNLNRSYDRYKWLKTSQEC